MCTSFIKKEENNCYIAMNFDNNGMKYSVETKKKDWFTISVIINNIKYPSFGFHKSGIFFNNLFVDENEKGKYRRGKGVVHSSRFLLDIINGKICVDDLEEYLKQTEIVNVPYFSTHNMICDTKENVWIIEPGRGYTHHSLKNGEFQIMTNTSIIDSIENGKKLLCKRYDIVKEYLLNQGNQSIDKSFEILNTVKQTEDEWITEFSMVFDKLNKTIYYCQNQDFKNIKLFHFE